MKYIAEPLKKEIERMLFLAGGKPSTKNPVNEAKSKKKVDNDNMVLFFSAGSIANMTKKAKNENIIKEDDEDTGSLFGDFEIEFSKAEKNKAIASSGIKAELPTAMKLAMVLNRIQAEDAELLGAYTGWKSRTTGSREDAATGQDTGTVFSKSSTEKLSGTEKREKGSAELRDMQKGFVPVTLPSISPNMTDEERKQTAKWLSLSKNRFMISYVGGTLTPVGKAQIEFLARILSNSPLDYKDEKILLKSKYSNTAQSNAYGILYDYYKHVMIPIITSLGKRAKYTPYDTQVDIMLTDSLEHVLEQTVMGKYNPSSSNYGAWLMRSVKNRAIDQLKHITEFKFDEGHVYDMLSAINGPFEIASDLDPSKAYGNFSDVVVSKNNPEYWIYIYRNAMDALPDFTSGPKRTEEGTKSSPLTSEHLLNPSAFYKANIKDLTGAEIDTEKSYEMETELFPVKKLPEDAKMQIEIILDKVADKIIANYRDYGIKNIASSLRPDSNRDLFVDIMFALLNYGGFIDVYTNSFIAKNGSTYAAGTVAKKEEDGTVIKDKNGRVPETKKVWTVRSKGAESVMTDFANKFVENAKTKYGIENLPSHFTNNPADFIFKIYGALKYYFGFRGLENPIVKTERDKLNAIIKNYELATLAENKKHKTMKTEKYRSLLKEHFLKLLELNELDVIEDNPEDSPEHYDAPPEWGAENVDSHSVGATADLSEPEDIRPDVAVGVDEYSNLGKSIANVSGKLSPESKNSADAEISRILETGRSKMTHELYVGADTNRKNVFEYVTSVLGALYKDVSARQQDNVRQFMFTAFNPYGDKHGTSSKLARMIARNAGITYDLTSSKTIDAEYYIGIIVESIYKSIDYALKNYNPDKTSFGRFMFVASVGDTIDGIKERKYRTAFSGFGKTSGDEPIGGAEGEEGDETMFDRMQASEGGFTKEQIEGMKELYKAMGIFIREKLSNPRLKNLLEYYELFAEKGYSNSEIAEVTGTSELNVRQRKFKLEKLLTQFVEDGSLPMFLKKTAGVAVKFPNNKFSLSAKNTEDSAEPLYIYKSDATHPEGGEWVEMKKSNKAKRYMSSDTLGDIAFGKEETGEEEPLAEVRKMIREALKK